MTLKNNYYRLSVIIPAYRAEGVIFGNLEDLCGVLEKTGQSYEVICVVDGIADSTLNQAEKYASKNKKVKVFSYKINYGKGYAVRYGMEKAKGSVIGFIDAGNDLVYQDILKLLDIMQKENADIVIGSKRHPDSLVNYAKFRKISYLGYQL